MKGSEPKKGDVFDVDRIRNLVELMKEHDLREIDLKQDDQQIRLSRNLEDVAPRFMTQMAPAPMSPPAAPATTGVAAPPAESKNIVAITSPMIGTFYARPKPEAEAYVKVGDRVTPDKTVCLVEAMKTYNEIPAEVSGVIVAVLVENGDSVDFGRALFKVDTSK